MFTNCRGGISWTKRPEFPFDHRDPVSGPTENAETKSLWHNHFMCMDGESDNDEIPEELTFDPHSYWIHLLS